MNKDSFYYCDKIAQQSAREIKIFLEKRNWKVIDTQKNKLFQELDIDLIAERDENTFTVEIKGDTYHHTNNYFCEIISNINKNDLGCWYKTKSDYIAYYFVEQKELHLIDTKAAQEYVRDNEDKFIVKQAKTASTRGETYYYNKGLLVPRAELQKNVYTEIYNLKEYLDDDKNN